MENILTKITGLQTLLLTAGRSVTKLTSVQAPKNYLPFIEAEALTLVPVLSKTNAIQALSVQHELFYLLLFMTRSSKKPVAVKLFEK
jgi:hypothetical protein